MAIHEFDELTGRNQRRVPMLAGDCDKTATWVTLVGFRDGREATFGSWFVVDHDGDQVRAVHFPEDWRAVCRQVGLDDELTATEGYLETLARLEFARQATHLTCAKCGLEKNAPDAARYRCSAPAHDWTVAR